MSYERSAVVGLRSVLTFPGADPTGTNDSSGAFQAAVNALAGTGVALWVPAGTYKIASPILLASQLRIQGVPGASVLKSTMVTTGGSSNTVFTNAPVETALTTLAADAAVGAMEISTNASIAKGTRIILAGTNIGQQFVTTGVSGAGPYTVTLDTPIAWPYWLTGATVYRLASIQNVLIDGLTFTGTGDAFVFASAADSVLLIDCNVIRDGGTPTGQYLLTFATSSRFCRFDNVDIDGGGLAQGGAAFYSNYGSSFGHVSARDCNAAGTAAGLFILGSAYIQGESALSTGCDLGVLIAATDAVHDTVGSHDVQIGSISANNNSHGVIIQTGLGIAIGRVIAKYNGSNGSGYGLWANPQISAGVELSIGTLDTAYNAGWSVEIETGADVHIDKHVMYNDGHWVAGDGTNEGGYRIMGGSLTVNDLFCTFLGTPVTGHAGYYAISHLYGRFVCNASRYVWGTEVGAAYLIGAPFGSAAGSASFSNVRYDTTSSNGWYSLGLTTTPVHFGPNIDLSLVAPTNRILAPAGTLTVVNETSGSPSVFGAATSLTAASAQNVPAGNASTTSTSDLVLGAIQSKTGNITSFAIQHTGNASNVGGQTISYRVYVNGVAVVGAVIVGVATTAGNKAGNVNFPSMSVAIGDVISVQLTPSALLTAAITDVMCSVS